MDPLEENQNLITLSRQAALNISRQLGYNPLKNS
jgi:hypothetical protein